MGVAQGDQTSFGALFAILASCEAHFEHTTAVVEYLASMVGCNANNLVICAFVIALAAIFFALVAWH